MSHLIENVEQFIADDMSVLRELMHQVKGLSIVSTAPIIEEVNDFTPTSEAFEFEQ